MVPMIALVSNTELKELPTTIPSIVNTASNSVLMRYGKPL